MGVARPWCQGVAVRSALLLALLAAAPASAASVDVAPTTLGGEPAVNVSTVTESPSNLAVLATRATGACAATEPAQRGRSGSIEMLSGSAPTGSHAWPTTGMPSGRWTVCGYLVDPASGQTIATGSATVGDGAPPTSGDGGTSGLRTSMFWGRQTPVTSRSLKTFPISALCQSEVRDGICRVTATVSVPKATAGKLGLPDTTIGTARAGITQGPDGGAGTLKVRIEAAAARAIARAGSVRLNVRLVFVLGAAQDKLTESFTLTRANRFCTFGYDAPEGSALADGCRASSAGT